MRIRHLSVRNFRGICELDWSVPDCNVLCLIGRGDSTKSTILEALRYLFHPQRNLSFDDADFYLCDPSNTIKIEVVLGDLPDEFRDLETYGYSLCGWDSNKGAPTDDPGDGLEDALRVRLTVAGDLEPSWSVVKNDKDEGIPFKATDRDKVGVSLIGAIFDRHLTWSRGSILSELTETENITSALVGVARTAKAALDSLRADHLTGFDKAAEMAEDTARTLGVNITHSYKAHLDTDAMNVRQAGLALHDGDMPLRRLGLGSKRMLTMGLQHQALAKSHITLVDEVEVGLEPHRIARLLQHLQGDKNGQYFLTTHSPVVLRELTVADLHIVHCNKGKIEVKAVNIPDRADFIQGKIRSSAEAFLAPKIIVCEGATEVGFLRGLDDHWVKDGKAPFAYCGVALFDAHGAGEIKKIAKALKTLGYDIAVFADSDAPAHFSDDHATELQSAGIMVAKWGNKQSIEDCVFAEISWPGVLASLQVAKDQINDDTKLLSQVKSEFNGDLASDVSTWIESEALRQALVKDGKAPFAYCGVALFDAHGGGEIKKIAKTLKTLGYDIAVFADSDAPDNFSDADATELQSAGIMVAKWGNKQSIEDCVFAEIPWPGDLASDVSTWIESEALRLALGKAAKKNDWFKRQDKGREWAAAIADYFPTNGKSDLVETLARLRVWIDAPPDQPAPDQPAPDQPAPDQPAPDQAAPDQQ